MSEGKLKTVKAKWCNNNNVKLAYFGSQVDDADSIIEELLRRYPLGETGIKITPVKFNDETKMINELKSNLPNDTKGGSIFCSIKDYVFGISLYEFDTSARNLKYRFFVPEDRTDEWKLADENAWEDPFGVTLNRQEIPSQPPYLATAFITFQYSLESIFIKKVTGKEEAGNETLHLRRFPEPPEKQNSLIILIGFMPVLWGMTVFMNLLHPGREIAAEKYTKKPFLSAMGLNAGMFYLSHIVFAFLKVFLVIGICLFPITRAMGSISFTLFFAIVMCYGLGAVVFAALIASMFKTPNSTIKVLIISWIGLVILSIKSPPSHSKWQAYVSSLNINTAFRYAAESIAEFMNRGRVLGWLDIFEDASYIFSCGEAFLMIIFDIFWMLCMTFVFDRVFGQPDFSLRDVFSCYSPANCESDPIDGVSGTPSSINSDSTSLLSDSTETDSGRAQAERNIEVEGLVKIYSETGETAVAGLTLNAVKGEVAVLLGHNGAGKSTTFSAISGIIAPTAGMDPSARKNVQSLLEKEKEKRAILLTTHYMDEAERLGDWVFIMSHGQLVASGTNQYLKKKFGSGYLLTAVLMEEDPTLRAGNISRKWEKEAKKMEANANELVSICIRYCKGAQRGEIHGKQIEIILPEKAQDSFPSLFEHLELIQEISLYGAHKVPNPDRLCVPYSLRIKSFGLSLNTLEQVFIRIGEMVETALIKQNSQSDSNSSSSQLSNDSYAKLIEDQKKIPDKRYGNVLAQFRAIWRKRFLYMRRNWPQLVTQVLAPLAILGFVSFVANIKTASRTDQERTFSLSAFGQTRVPILMQSKSPLAYEYYELMRAAEGNAYVPVYNQSSDSLETIVAHLPKELPAHGIGAAFYPSRGEALFNGRAHHSFPTTIAAWNTARLRSLAGGGSGSIEPQVMVYSNQADSQTAVLPSELINFILAPLLILALSLLTSTFVMFLIEERATKFAHQQSLSGISPLTFWSATFLYDFIFYLIIIVVFLIIFCVTKWMQNVIEYVFVFWLLYFFACMPFIYSVSFLFSSPSKASILIRSFQLFNVSLQANVLLIVWQILAALFALIIFNLLKYLYKESNFLSDAFDTACLFLLPSYAMATALVKLAIHDPLYAEYKDLMAVNPEIAAKFRSSLLAWDNIGKLWVCMLAFGILSSILFMALQFKSIRKQISQIWDIGTTRKGKQSSQVTASVQDIIIDEQALLNKKNTAIDVNSGVHPDTDKYALITDDLVKKYGSFAAVNELSLAVKEGECFGLLGVNGAGKTTAFNMLTGQTFATSGTAKIDKRDVTDHIIMAQMHGYSHYKDKAKVILESVEMVPQADKLVRYYSGGQRRRLSVGAALLAPTKMIILDEPTAGIDPRARREIWELLLEVRKHSQSAIMLTSHSMDECEALCSRIAVLNKGKLIAIGESQTLKSLYGNNYTMTMTVPSGDESMKSEVKKEVEQTFTDSVIKTTEESKTLNLKWLIPKRPNDKWSEKFSQMQQLAQKYDIKDYCLAQSSLEDAFLRLSEPNGNNDPYLVKNDVAKEEIEKKMEANKVSRNNSDDNNSLEFMNKTAPSQKLNNEPPYLPSTKE
ncbi:hypothetical protein WR25_10459 isoform B [Diploscapter pachys]|nr:hypothetical protein WR25_10459 isoform B [Diploscapter pachys]